MSIKREQLFKFPWSKTDNPGAWVEVTDECDMYCPGCYRHRLEGHRPLEEVKRDILFCQEKTNCERIAIAGGEPLIYPHIVEVVDFIARRKMKPMILTNGEKFSWELACELKKAGLTQVYFHVDSGQERPDWEGKDEEELNTLRQRFADLVFELGNVQCGFNITVFRSTLKYIPHIVEWARANIHKVQFLSLIAFRGMLISKGIRYIAEGKEIDPTGLKTLVRNPEEITLSTDEMFETLEESFPDTRPCAYLGGTSVPTTYKFLILMPVGSKKKIYGAVGARTMELAQFSYHLIKGKYNASLKKPKIGKKLFFLSIFDVEVRKAFAHFLKTCVKNPVRILDKIYLQCINLQQPNESIGEEKNLCDGCVNLMAYKGKLINSCALDEYRMFGGPVEPVVLKRKAQDLS
jgi:organic radical activating enzyme